MNELYNKFKKWCAANDADPYIISEYTNRMIAEERHGRVINSVEDNAYLVGKCFKMEVRPYNRLFPSMWKYLKVVSNRAENEYRVTCLVFDEHPWYWFNYNSDRFAYNNDYYEGAFDFDGIYVEDIMVESPDTFLPALLRDYIEISQTEYRIAYERYCEELINLKWEADHNRSGGILPIDEKWKAEAKWRNDLA